MPTPKFSLPLIMPGQTLKHLTINEALVRLDGVVHLSIVGTENSPNSAAETGQCYFVGSTPTGVFAAHSEQIAAKTEEGWMFLSPKPGWICWDETLGQLQVFKNSRWTGLSDGNTAERRINQISLTESNGVYTVPPHVISLLIEVQAGGGGGAGAVTVSTEKFVGAGGGGGGGFASLTIDTESLGKTYAYSIGHGGAGGAAEEDAPLGARDGQDGGPSTFVGHNVDLNTTGGKGARERAASSGNNEYLGGVGGQAIGGTVNVAGQSGNGGITSSVYCNTGNGAGGSSQYGHGGAFGNGNGKAGTGFGAGGSGACMVPGLSLNRDGGSGTPGFIKITEYY